jgi:hypothetical protein
MTEGDRVSVNWRGSCRTPERTVGVEPDPPGIRANRPLPPMEGRLPRRPQGVVQEVLEVNTCNEQWIR